MIMKRVGILTRHCYPNYGSLLQAIGLSRALCDIGVQAEVIDYVPPADRPLRLGVSSLRESRLNDTYLRRGAYLAVQGPNMALMAWRFRTMQQRELTLSHPVWTPSGLKTVAADYDAVIVGSDQIWNKIHGAYDGSYFLDGVGEEVRRLSYAASFGGSLPSPPDDHQVRRWLENLDVVSTRDANLVAPLRDCGIDARYDVDPVLLHDRDFWDRFAGAEVPTEPYILVYRLHNTAALDKTVETLARERGLAVRQVTADARKLLDRAHKDYLVDVTGFVRLIRDARVVVTDSFHALLFSLMFSVEVYPVMPEKNSERLRGLLTQFRDERCSVDDAVASSKAYLKSQTYVP